MDERDVGTVRLEDRIPIPAIKSCWECVRPVLPESNPLDPKDPSTNLDTLAAIATAKWLNLEDSEAQVTRLAAVVEAARAVDALRGAFFDHAGVAERDRLRAALVRLDAEAPGDAT